VADCFDLVPEDGLGGITDESTHAQTVDLIKSWFRMLGEWRDAITTLAGDLAEAAGNTIPSIAFPPAMSEAATRYVGHELLEWHQALEGWRWGTIEFFLGRDEHDSARLLFLLDGIPGGDDGDGGGEDKPKKRGGRRVAVECSCQPPRKLHMTPKQIEDGPVICGLCNAPFEAPEDSDQDETGGD
jgi:hypothetical protein